MSLSLNDDLDDMTPHPNELGEDAIVGLDVQPLTSQANPGATKDMIFTSVPVKRELPEMDKEFVILSGRVSKATDLATLSRGVQATQRMSQEQAELAEQLSPGFVDEGTPIGMYTAIPTKTMAEETVINLGTRLDKEIAEMLDTCEMVYQSVAKNADLVVKDLEIQCMEHLHMSSEYMSGIVKHLKDNPGFKLNNGEKVSDVLDAVYTATIGMDYSKIPAEGSSEGLNSYSNTNVSASFLRAIMLGGSGIIVLPGGKEMTATDDGTDTVISNRPERDYECVSMVTFVDHIFGNNSINAIREIAGMLTALKNKAEYYLKDGKEKLSSDDMTDKREEKLQVIMGCLIMLNGLNTAARCANDQVHAFIQVGDAVMKTLGEISQRLVNVGIALVEES